MHRLEGTPKADPDGRHPVRAVVFRRAGVRCDDGNRTEANRNAGMRYLTLVVALCLARILIAGASVNAQEQPFSGSPEYRSMLQELHQEQVRPTRLSAGALPDVSQQPKDLKVEDSGGMLRVESELWRLEIKKDRWAMSLTNKQTGLLWQIGDRSAGGAGLRWLQKSDAGAKDALAAAAIQHIERRGDTWHMVLRAEGSNVPVEMDLTVLSATMIRLSIQAAKLGDDAHLQMNVAGAGPFFGLGERFEREKLDGLKTVLRPEDLLGQPGHNWTYMPVPLLYTPRGLGLYLDTPDVSNVDLSQAERQGFSVQLDHPSADAYFFVEKGPKETIEDYTALTGRTPLSPPWAFGIWVCAYQGPERVLADAKRLRQLDIPTSAIWIFDVMDRGDVMGWPLWWTGYYPHPRELTDQLHGMGFKVLTYVHPYLRSVLAPYLLPNPAFEKGARDGLFVVDANGKPTGPAFEPYLDGNIDFTRPANVDWWEQRLRDILLQDNFDGWMEDYGEWVNNGDRFAVGVTGRTMANLNPLWYHRIAYTISRKAKPDVVEFARSGYAGSQGYTRVVWGGDQFPDWTEDHGLPSAVRGGITAGLSGFAVWGPDIDANGHSKELWTRWTEFGALTPIMRNHPWDKPYDAVDLWYDAQTIDLFRQYARLHISLFPYFYTYAREAEKTGLPIMRHPMLESPDDPKTWDADGEYLLGDKLLVAPVVQEGSVTRSLYLPKGAWVNYWSGQTMEGGREVQVAAPLDQIPLLVRSGSILPFISPDTKTLAADLTATGSNGEVRVGVDSPQSRALSHDLTWRLFPAQGTMTSTFALYDGTTATAMQSPSQIKVQVEHSPSTRQYELVMPATSRPHAVMLGGSRLSELDEAGYRKRGTGWWLDAKNEMLHVFLLQSNFEVSVAR